MRSRHLFGLIIGLLAACKPPAGSRAAIVDDLGNRVAVASAPRRIVSLAPASTELLFALGYGDRVVGRTRWCDYPAEVEFIPSVGDGLNPNIEAVAARKPDLVVMYATAANAPAVEQLQRLGIPAINIKLDRLDDIPHASRLLSSVLGDSTHVDSLARRFEGSLDSLRKIERPERRRVTMVVWDNPPMVIGAGSFLNELITLAGGKNVFDDLAQPSPTVSIETIASRKPDLFLSLASDTTGPSFAQRPEWQAVQAVQERRFGYLHGTEFNRPGLRLIQAVTELDSVLRRVGR